MVSSSESPSWACLVVCSTRVTAALRVLLDLLAAVRAAKLLSNVCSTPALPMPVVVLVALILERPCTEAGDRALNPRCARAADRKVLAARLDVDVDTGQVR